MLNSLVPKTGMKKKARLIIEIFEEKEVKNGRNKPK